MSKPTASVTFSLDFREDNERHNEGTLEDWIVQDAIYTPGYPLRVKLPSSITEEQLRRLLDVCPTFDPPQTQRVSEWIRAHPDESIMDYPGVIPGAAIGFMLVGFDSPYSPTLAAETKLMTLVSRLIGLHLILNEKRDAYLNEQSEEYP